MSVLHAFSDEALAIEQTLTHVSADDWSRPGLGEWTIAELFAHTIRAAVLIDRYLNMEEPATEAAHDRVSYFDTDLGSMAKSIAQRARDEVTAIGIDKLPHVFADGWRASLNRAVTLPEDMLMHTIRGAMQLQEYAATRVFELCVHHMDLQQALELAVAPSPTGLRVTAGILDALLDGERPAALADDVDFVLAATGRSESRDRRLPLLT